MNCPKFVFLIVAVILFSQNALAKLPSYYPESFKSLINNSHVSNSELKGALFDLLNSYHQRHAGSADTLGTCQNQNAKCYRHKFLSYREARTHLFGRIHLEKDKVGYYVEDVYCQKRFSTSSAVGPGKIPNHTKVNCEHTWPQSKFTNNFPHKLQKSDLHHLFPTDSKANSVRANHPFANVIPSNILAESNCTSSAQGASKKNGRDGFEPPNEHKGNVARAIFYFSVRYRAPVSDAQEATLRKWHNLDPVDDAEISRNNEIEKVQFNRNPFIDAPELISQVSDF